MRIIIVKSIIRTILPVTMELMNSTQMEHPTSGCVYECRVADKIRYNLPRVKKLKEEKFELLWD